MTPYHGREPRDDRREEGRNEPHQVAGAAKGISLSLEFRIARGDQENSASVSPGLASAPTGIATTIQGGWVGWSSLGHGTGSAFRIVMQ
jgi:hypothetical protein